MRAALIYQPANQTGDQEIADGIAEWLSDRDQAEVEDQADGGDGPWEDVGREVAVVTSDVEHVPGSSRGPGRVSLDELAHRKGVRPVASLEEMREDGVFASDEELEDFLRYVHAARRSDLG